MRAWKCLREGGVAQISGVRWPAPPRPGEPGAWVESRGPFAPCKNGVHVCRAKDLPYWLAPELWEVECDGESAEAPDALIVRRARLVRRIEGWDAASRELAAACAGRAKELLAGPGGDSPLATGLAADVEVVASRGRGISAAYVCAMVAGAAAGASGADGEAAVAAERAWQAAWLAQRLGLEA